jgi:hypothetical protein
MHLLCRFANYLTHIFLIIWQLLVEDLRSRRRLVKLRLL